MPSSVVRKDALAQIPGLIATQRHRDRSLSVASERMRDEAVQEADHSGKLSAYMDAKFDNCIQNQLNIVHNQESLAQGQASVSEKINKLEVGTKEFDELEETINSLFGALDRVERYTWAEFGDMKSREEEILSHVLDVRAGQNTLLRILHDIIRQVEANKADFNSLREEFKGFDKLANWFFDLEGIQESIVKSRNLTPFLNQIKRPTVSVEEFRTTTTRLQASNTVSNEKLDRLLELNQQQATPEVFRYILNEAVDRAIEVLGIIVEQVDDIRVSQVIDSSHNQLDHEKMMHLLGEAKEGAHEYQNVAENLGKLAAQQETTNQQHTQIEQSILNSIGIQIDMLEGVARTPSGMEESPSARRSGHELIDSAVETKKKSDALATPLSRHKRLPCVQPYLKILESSTIDNGRQMDLVKASMSRMEECLQQLISEFKPADSKLSVGVPEPRKGTYGLLSPSWRVLGELTVGLAFLLYVVFQLVVPMEGGQEFITKLVTEWRRVH